MSKTTSEAARRPFECTALVLQGGGALGSYQGGVVEGLMESGIEPDWVAGISIGALNSAIIAGNAPEQRLAKLRGFWETICKPAVPFLPADWLRSWIELGGDEARRAFSGFEAWRATAEGKRGFFTPRGWLPWLGWPEAPDRASFYATDQLKSTLERFVDFDRIQDSAMRVSVGAVDVETGNFVYFDNHAGDGHARLHVTLRPEHFMASGALPPGFAAVEIDGRHYWDGGLVSNTPLQQVLEVEPRRDTLVFQVDLWSAKGEVPRNVYDAQERMKEIQYSSRTRAVTDAMAHDLAQRRLLREVLACVPPAKRRASDWCQEAEAAITSKQYSVVHLIYRDKPWEGHAKDYEFSELTMLDHWASGLADMRAALAHKDWLLTDERRGEFHTHDAQAAWDAAERRRAKRQAK